MSYACDTCDRWFGSQESVEQHMNALDHWDAESYDDDDAGYECDRCERTFASWQAVKQHMTAVDHWFTDLCETCSRRFVNKHAAIQHMDALGHRSAQYCFDCDRYFQRPIDLLNHRNSSVHLRAGSVPVASSQPAPRPSPAPVVGQAPFPVAAVRTPTGTAPRPPPVANMLPALSAIPNQVVRPAPAIMSTQPTNPVPSGAQPANTGTRSAPFSVYVERDPGIAMNCHYHSITFKPPYLAFSFEELRLVDYAARIRPANANKQADAPGSGTGVDNGSSSGSGPPQATRSGDIVSALAASSSAVSAPLAVIATYQDRSTQTDMSPAGSTIYLSATSTRATTPVATTIGGRNTSSIAT